MKCQDLVGIGLEGGTLVEYKDNCGFHLEYDRATIKAVAVKGETFSIETDSEEAFWTHDLSPGGLPVSIEKRDGIYWITCQQTWYYAVAPSGVLIPKKPNYMDVSEEQFADRVKDHLTGSS